MTKRKLLKRIAKLEKTIASMQVFIRAEAAETLDRDHQLFEMIDALVRAEGAIAVVVHESDPTKAN